MAIDRKMIAASVLGILLGASAMLAYQGRLLDNLYLQISKSTNANQDLQQQNEQLMRKLAQPNSEPAIESIRVSSESEGDLSEFERTQIEQFVKKQLEFLIGTPLTTLERSPDLPSRLVDGRTVSVDQQQFTVHVKTVVVQEKLYVNIGISPSKNS
jgi:ABC-type oligopeptide transport system substrate-binding subunit